MNNKILGVIGFTMFKFFLLTSISSLFRKKIASQFYLLDYFGGRKNPKQTATMPNSLFK